MQPDLVGIVESIYQLEADASSWIQRVLVLLEPWVGDGVGLFGFTYSVSPDSYVTPGAFAAVDCAEYALRVLPRAATLHDPEVVRRAYVLADFGVASLVPGWHTSEGREYAVRGGIDDVWIVNGRNPGNHGCSLFVNRRHEGPPSARDQQVLVRIATHVGAAYRLRERLRYAEATGRAEAIITPEGKLVHAVGNATEQSSRDELRAAVLAVDRARAKLRRTEPARALGAWRGLVSARWTLIDHFESDGRRYLLAEENEPEPHPAPKLSARERQVVANAVLGRSNKEIAYALGLAHSTVRVLLTRAAKKLRASSRHDLVKRYSALSSVDAVPRHSDRERSRS